MMVLVGLLRRIYDKHQLTITPSGELTVGAKSFLADLAKLGGAKELKT